VPKNLTKEVTARGFAFHPGITRSTNLARSSRGHRLRHTDELDGIRSVAAPPRFSKDFRQDLAFDPQFLGQPLMVKARLEKGRLQINPKSTFRMVSTTWLMMVGRRQAEQDWFAVPHH
jgi:hypothetical protein